MTETQAMSGAAGTPANPVEEEGTVSGASATGRAAVGRATVPAESTTTSASPSGASTSTEAESPSQVLAESSSTTFSRPPGIAPPEPDGEVTSTSRTGSVAGSETATGGKSALKSVTAAGQLGAARVTEAVRAARSNVTSAASRGPRRARLALKRIDPWSVMKFSFAVSLVLFLVIIVATAVLYLALDAMHVFDSINGSLGELIQSGGGTNANGGFQITAGGVIGTSALIGAVNVVLFTALATLSAFIYNVCADLVGGIEVTLAERD
ncbi:cobalamin biosynthesis Mg chelatase CobN [Allocatelliglobosispora scoriae]|uniref:Cobalamin biosynthesis Mg chelatase CobN n=1 Tax=Allocatelliglobosispora scoriae TaxID=643052 RepID=A0A841BV40_9ACTN|nr:DUF3566 domain-containing protein [Allocatelliglobosispora scoriae]MBB5871029.1 cobalamin biosynthesis Mg chelatase CobN [Allocatelliglobosispora scoriae]